MSEAKITAQDLERMTAALPEAMMWQDALGPYELREILSAMGYFDLLEAARQALTEMCYTKAPCASFTDAVDALDAAIAKATGD